MSHVFWYTDLFHSSMTRKLRETSHSGIYHVMIRGVNKQNIFETTGDYMKMMGFLKDLLSDFIVNKEHLHDAFSIYAYCLMPNHIHILLKEGEKATVSEIIRRLNVRYATYYNWKYKRVGHLFQNRFKSEPVNDDLYLSVLLRYIHQNPLKAGIVENVNDYIWSSWREYTDKGNGFELCDTKAMIELFGMKDISSWVEDILSDDEDCLDVDNENHEREKMRRQKEREAQMEKDSAETIQPTTTGRKPRAPRVKDWIVWKVLENCTGTTNATDFQHLPREVQREALLEAHRQGASYRQLQHLTGLTYYQVQSARSRQPKSIT